MMKQKPTIIYENTVAGSFVRRINRFTAEVLIDGETELVHVKNTVLLGKSEKRTVHPLSR